MPGFALGDCTFDRVFCHLRFTIERFGNGKAVFSNLMLGKQAFAWYYGDMDTLFTEMENERKSEVAPLAVRMRPRTLEEVVGQEEAVGPGSWLRSAIEHDQLSSVILFGPAGTGKTSLAHVVAETTKATFVEVSAIGGTVSDLRREIDAADKRLSMHGLRTILFVDEIHRFNRSQQDALLHAVEDQIGRAHV